MFDAYGNDQPVGRMILHRVVPGDTLGALALHYYGDASLYCLILDHNTHYIDNANVLNPGIRLVIPYHAQLKARTLSLW